MAVAHAYFRREGGLFHPDRTARSPWSREQQSGLAIAGLLVRAIEHMPAPAPLRMARLNVDFLGAVLMKPTEARAEIVREGKRMQVIAASLWVDGAIAACATALRVHRAAGPAAAAPALGYPGPDQTPPTPIAPYFDAGHPLETRMLQRATRDGAPGVFWSRFNSSFVEGEPTSAVIRACMTADIATGPASTLSSREWRIPNADLSLYFAREPEGDWLMGAAQMDIASEGVALTHSTLADETGIFGYARQTLILSRVRTA